MLIHSNVQRGAFYLDRGYGLHGQCLLLAARPCSCCHHEGGGHTALGPQRGVGQILGAGGLGSRCQLTCAL